MKDLIGNCHVPQCVRAAINLSMLFVLSSPIAVSANEALLQAASDGDLATVQSLLGNHVDVNYRRADGSTPLAWAVYEGHAPVVDALLDAGADVNAANDYGVTPLSLTCTDGNSDLAEKLLAAGADPDIAKRNGETPLMTCSGAGAVRAVGKLLRHKAKINSVENEKGQTALMWAAAEGHPEVIALLAKHGADVNVRSSIIPEPEPYIIDITDGLTIFGSNYPATVRFAGTSGGFTAIHFVARQGNIESARALLAAGADVNSPHQEYGSPLVIAIASGHEQLARFLLDQGADPNIPDAWGVAPLHYAMHKGVLILNNFKPWVTDKFGWERNNMPGLVKALLDAGADPNARIEHSFAYMDNLFLGRSMSDPPQIDPVGATPLLVAAASGDIESMQLLEKVSDHAARTVGGATLFMLAAGAGTESGARTQQDALEAAKYALSIGGGSVNDRLTEVAIDGPAKGRKDGRTTLHFATTLGWTGMIRFLVEQGADINARDRYQMSPLEIALGDPEGRYARQIGAGNYDTRFRNPSSEGKGNKKLADLLLELGAEPFTGTYRNRSGE